MQKIRAAKRYAKALLAHAIEKQQTDVVFQEMTSLLKAMEENIDFQRLLLSPIVKSVTKRNVLVQIFPDKSDLVRQLIEVLDKNKRFSLTKAIAKSYIELYHQHKQRQIAQITTAQPLSEEMKNDFLLKIKQLTGNENIELRSKVDENIIGGFILRVGDLQYNASVLSKLQHLEQTFQR